MVPFPEMMHRCQWRGGRAPLLCKVLVHSLGQDFRIMQWDLLWWRTAILFSFTYANLCWFKHTQKKAGSRQPHTTYSLYSSLRLEYLRYYTTAALKTISASATQHKPTLLSPTPPRSCPCLWDKHTDSSETSRHHPQVLAQAPDSAAATPRPVTQTMDRRTEWSTHRGKKTRKTNQSLAHLLLQLAAGVVYFSFSRNVQLLQT